MLMIRVQKVKCSYIYEGKEMELLVHPEEESGTIDLR